jgi:two-component system, OmpR family, sensor histidine kinase MprB
VQDRARQIAGGRPGGGGRPDEGRPPAIDGQPLAGYDTVTQVIDPSGAVQVTVGGVALPVDDGDLALAQGAGPTRVRTVAVDGVDYRMATSSRPEGGAVQVARDLADTDDQEALAALVGWFVAQRATAPIERLTEAAERVARTQDLTTPIGAGGTDEVGRLTTSFNTMLGALDRSRRQQQGLVQDAGHELRTPLTSLRTNIDLLARAELDPSLRREVVADLQTEVAELSDLTAELVDLATDQRAAEAPTTVDLAVAAEDAAERCRRRSGRPVTVQVVAPATVQVRRGRLDRALSNLLDNAVKFSPADSPVEVVVEGARVEVRDHGPGIAEADRARVFDRFYRADATRTLAGSGLGLAIVKQFADDHGGTVRAGDAPGGGAAVSVDLGTARPS